MLDCSRRRCRYTGRTTRLFPKATAVCHVSRFWRRQTASTSTHPGAKEARMLSASRRQVMSNSVAICAAASSTRHLGLIHVRVCSLARHDFSSGQSLDLSGRFPARVIVAANSRFEHKDLAIQRPLCRGSRADIAFTSLGKIPFEGLMHYQGPSSLDRFMTQGCHKQAPGCKSCGMSNYWL